MDDLEKRWAKVAAAIQRRMIERGVNQTDLVAASGVSAETIRPIRQGRPGNYSDKTKARVSMALGWTPDSIDRILAGNEPELAGQPDDVSALAAALDELLATTTAMRERIRELEARAEGSSDPGAPPQ